MLLHGDQLNLTDVLAGVGWELTAEGACHGDRCVPLGDATSLETVAAALGMPIVEEPAHGLRALGPASGWGRALVTEAAPDLELPYALAEGNWRLAEQRGRRTVVVAWAPW